MLSFKKKTCFKNNCNYPYLHIILSLKISKDSLPEVRKENHTMLHIFTVWKKKNEGILFFKFNGFLGMLPALPLRNNNDYIATSHNERERETKHPVQK